MNQAGSIPVDMLPYRHLLVAEDATEDLQPPDAIVRDPEPQLGEGYPHLCSPSPFIDFCSREPDGIPGVIFHPAVL